MTSAPDRIKKLAKYPNFADIVNSKLCGVEKESLRILQNGELANNNHPKNLGAPLTHPNITTDYAESQLELITGAHHNTRDTLQELYDIHSFVHHHIQPKQLLWPFSIPGKLPKPKEIIIGKYGTSNNAKFKELYRLGLSYRYGKTMQLICGIHFNFSFSQQLWPAYFKSVLDTPNFTQADIDTAYMHVIRNYMRVGWITLYLFGASPAFNTDFISKDAAVANYLKLLNKSTYLAPYGTSLRASSLGYHNKDNVDHNISYNSIQEYATGLHKAITTESPEFAELGRYRRDRAIQINTNLLQIENEYYGSVRPKPNIKIKNIPLYKSLYQNGISYIELRNIDLNPYLPVGIDHSQAVLLELLMYYCLISESPDLTTRERAHIKANSERTSLLGRQPNLQLNKNGESISLQNWARNIFADLEVIADHFDHSLKQSKNELKAPYSETVQHYRSLIEDSSLTPSGLIKTELEQNELDYISLFLAKAKEHSHYFAEQGLSAEKLALYNSLAVQSINKRIAEEKRDLEQNLTLDQYLEKYYNS